MFQPQAQNTIAHFRIKLMQATSGCTDISALAGASISLATTPVAYTLLGHMLTLGNFPIGLTADVSHVEAVTLLDACALDHGATSSATLPAWRMLRFRSERKRFIQKG
jgi:hypothetical protein